MRSLRTSILTPAQQYLSNIKLKAGQVKDVMNILNTVPAQSYTLSVGFI